MEELIHIDNLCAQCGYFTGDTPVNGGYGCNNKDCEDGEYVNGKGDVMDYFETRRKMAVLFTRRNIKCNRRLAKKFMIKAEQALNNNKGLFGFRFQGSCYARACPLGYVADDEDFVRFGEDPNMMSKDEWLVIEK